MRKILIGILCMIMSDFIAVGQNTIANKWTFHGITIDEDLGCVNKVHTRQEMVWIPFTESYKDNRDTLNRRLKEQYSPDYVSVKTVRVEKGKAQYIGLVEKSRTCTGNKARAPIVSSYSFYSGDTKESIIQQAESDKKLYREILSYKVIKLLNSDEEIRRLQQEQGNLGKKGRTEERAVFDGLEARFIKKEGATPLILAQFTNTKAGKVAIVVVSTAENTFEYEQIQPNEKLSKTYKTNQLRIQVKYVEATPKEVPVDIIKTMRIWLEGTIFVQKDGLRQERKTSTACLCVRG